MRNLRLLILLFLLCLPSPLWAYRMAYGTFTGNGTSQSVTGVAFAPDTVIVKVAQTNDRWVLCTKTAVNLCVSHENSSTATTDCVTAFNSDGFTVGANVFCNDGSDTVHWVAFGISDGNYASGVFTGNGKTQLINLGWQPELVVCKATSSGRAPYFKTPDMSGSNALAMSLQVEASRITIETNGFTAAGDCNVSATEMHYYAFKNRILYLNPGSAGPRRFSLPVTLARITVQGRGPSPEIISLA